MYSRYVKKGGDGLSEEEREIAKYGLPPKYDGNRFRRPPRDEDREDRPGPGPRPPEEAGERPTPPRFPHGAAPGPHRDGDASPHRDGDGGKIERLIESLGERLGTEEILILALILILSGSGGGECEDAGDVILLLALLLILG
ncbi:MAG: hypothetical protein IIZ35_02925 [Clostridia bacterium]|nr:hypothetical protein [Clostridia bacterium]MBQ6677126.1 hypothetical protein [Clostridia bacterium]